MVRDYKMALIKKEYVKYSELLYNFQYHIETCHSENIILLSDRNQILNQLDDIVKMISNIYNSCIDDYDDSIDNINNNIAEHDSLFSTDFVLPTDIDHIYDNIHSLMPLYQQINSQFKSLIFEPYKEIRSI